jgi:hypothetical protein
MLHVRWRSAARTNGKVVLFEGDGSLLMHIQELETIKRHRLKLLICVLNDGAYGAEIHKLRADGVDDSGAIFGRTDLAAIATCVPTGLFLFWTTPQGPHADWTSSAKGAQSIVRDRRCPHYRARTKVVVGREPWSVAPQFPPGLFIFVRWD